MAFFHTPLLISTHNKANIKQELIYANIQARRGVNRLAIFDDDRLEYAQINHDSCKDGFVVKNCPTVPTVDKIDNNGNFVNTIKVALQIKCVK